MEVLKEKYEKNGMTEIKRARLLDDCDDRIYEATSGETGISGGSFQRSLNYLEELRALKCIKKGKKLTVVIPDMKRIENLLANYKLKGSIDEFNGTITQRKIEDDLWEQIVEKETKLAFDTKSPEIIENLRRYMPIKNKAKLTESHLLLKEIAGKIASHVLSRFLEFYVQHQDPSFQLSEDIMVDLGLAARNIGMHNIRAPFKVIIEFSGFPETGVKLEHIVGPALLKMMGENFRLWATKVLHHRFSHEDNKYLSQGHFHLLSPIAKGYFEEIYQPLLEYYANFFNQ